MTGSGQGDRRFRAAGRSVTTECRLCWRTVVLQSQHIEATEQHVYVRCPHCGGSFPIRHSDLEAYRGHETSAAS
jgi:DNA-directed RNA polymerase subunit RPC12/RpoP